KGMAPVRDLAAPTSAGRGWGRGRAQVYRELVKGQARAQVEADRPAPALAREMVLALEDREAAASVRDRLAAVSAGRPSVLAMAALPAWAIRMGLPRDDRGPVRGMPPSACRGLAGEGQERLVPVASVQVRALVTAGHRASWGLGVSFCLPGRAREWAS